MTKPIHFWSQAKQCHHVSQWSKVHKLGPKLNVSDQSCL